MPGFLSSKRKAIGKIMAFSFFPRTVYKTESQISGEILVKEQLGKYTLHVQNLTQSGGIVKTIWKKALKQVERRKKEVKRCLVLGLGGGTAVQLIKARWPEAKIVGIEIDLEIIKIGKKFFGLGETKNLKIVNAEAINWIANYYGESFDLILMDLYIGGKLSRKAESDEFLKKIKKLLSKKGMIVFNWLKNKNEKKFVKKLKENFLRISRLEMPANLFLLVD